MGTGSRCGEPVGGGCRMCSGNSTEPVPLEWSQWRTNDGGELSEVKESQIFIAKEPGVFFFCL